MSQEFKPGDVVRPKATFCVAEVKDTGLLKFENNGTGLFFGEPDMVELVEPTITVKRLREVCEDVLNEDCFAGIYAVGRKEAAERIFRELTGEPLQQDGPNDER